MKYISENFPTLARAGWVTIQLSLLSFAFGLIIGMVIAILRVSPLRPLRSFGSFYVAAMVNTPIAFLMFFGFYGIPKLGPVVSGFKTAVVMMSLYVGGYVAEAVRSGINTVPNGQAEAARALGLTFGQTVRNVILPQALRLSPAWPDRLHRSWMMLADSRGGVETLPARPEQQALLAYQPMSTD